MEALLATTSSPLLRRFNEAGVLDVADVHAARRWGVLTGERREEVWLAAALSIGALRRGSVAVDLATVAEQVFDQAEQRVDASDLPWPAPDQWATDVASSPMTTEGAGEASSLRPLRFVDGLLYLERYWEHQESVRRALMVRRDAPVDASLDVLRASLDALFTGEDLDDDEADLQRRAVATAICARISVIAGGPGTGKTSTVARLLAALWDQDPHLRIALCAPTGKAAARLEESLRQETERVPESSRTRIASAMASTVHKLLGWVPQTSTRFAHHQANPLPYDVVIVDEASMVSLFLMARLVEALPPTARLILVGDPDQLASVEAGAVLGDIVHATMAPLPELAAQLAAVDADGWARRGLPPRPVDPPTGVVVLRHFFRFRGDIQDLAVAIRDGDAEAALAVMARGGDVRLVTDPLDGSAPGSLAELRQRLVDAGIATIEAAAAGDAVTALARLDDHRLLCGHRNGPFGVATWSWRAESWVLEEARIGSPDDFYVGRPLIVNKNLRDVALFNGDTGVVVADPQGHGMAVFARGGGLLELSPTSLSEVTSLWAMTVHKSQGSQFRHVSLILPPEGSPLLTRELLYTAVTRASQGVTVYGTPDAVRTAIGHAAARASGLGQRLSAGALRRART